jgi:aspartate/tyrosine/aromatic aminotransferase
MKENRVQGVQALSGTGGLRVFGELMHRHGHKNIYVPNPTWGNHHAIFANSGLKVHKYSYYDAATSDLDFKNMMKDFKNMPEGSIVLLHACAHNPTGWVNTTLYYLDDDLKAMLDLAGPTRDSRPHFFLISLSCRMDPTMEQWKEISDTVKKQKLIPFFDCAYQVSWIMAIWCNAILYIWDLCLRLAIPFVVTWQGFASGDAVKDAAAVRMFVDDGHLISMVQSFSKNFGLYGQRVGALSVVGANEDETKRVVSQMKMVIRPMYSNPPRHGARLVTTILEDPRLTADFIEQCRGMADRIKTMRTSLHDALTAAGSTKDWDHIVKQIGMFAYSGLDNHQVMTMREKHHVYCTADGRISMAVSVLRMM